MPLFSLADIWPQTPNAFVNNISFYYTVGKLPREIYIDWKERLRGECKQGVRLTFIDSIRRHHIAWESPQMQSRLRILRQIRDESEEKDVDASKLNMIKNVIMAILEE